MSSRLDALWSVLVWVPPPPRVPADLLDPARLAAGARRLPYTMYRAHATADTVRPGRRA